MSLRMTNDMNLSAEIMNKVPAVFYIAKLEPTRRFVLLQGQVDKILGRSVDTILQKSDHYIRTLDRDNVAEYFTDLSVPDYEINYRVKVDSVTKWVTDKGFAEYCPQEKIWTISGFIFDNTEFIESERQIESILASRTKALQETQDALEEALDEQKIAELQRFSILEKHQLRQSITFEISSCDSITQGHDVEAANIICHKLKSGLLVQQVQYIKKIDASLFKLQTDSENKADDKNEQTFDVSNDFLTELNSSLCLDIENVSESPFKDAIYKLLPEGMNVRSVLLFPVKYEQKLVGFFNIISRSARQWPIDEIIFVSALVDQLRATLTNKDKLIANQKLHQLAYYDTLTGLENRAAFFENAKYAISLVKRSKQQHAFVYIDLDNFKFVNDTYGHDAGDEVLKKTAQVLKSQARASDHCARVGGDEFNLLLMEVSSVDVVSTIILNVLKSLATPILLDTIAYSIQVSIGVAFMSADTKDLKSLMKDADTAMYEAKRNGKNQFKFFNE